MGELIAFLAYLSMFYAPLGAISNFTTWLTSFLSGSKRVLELLDSPIDIMEPENPTPWIEPRGKIKFDHVTFGYERHQPVVKDVSFEVAPGEMVGIVGRSGSGKTTMVNLLGRFYDAQEGTISVDDIDVRELSMHELREGLGVVFQDSFLFRGTVWSNLSYGRQQTTIEQGLAAAKASGAHDFICRKQLGYETQLGERGSGLSGGEQQRLSIARTLLYDPKILVLDEATSNIDAEAEKCIQEALEVLIKGRTTIAIAHRLSTLRNADRILVFDRGRLVEQGSHVELLTADGVYARLVRIQTQVSKDPNVDKLLYRADEDQEAKSSTPSESTSETEQTESIDADAVSSTKTRKSQRATSRPARSGSEDTGGGTATLVRDSDESAASNSNASSDSAKDGKHAKKFDDGDGNSEDERDELDDRQSSIRWLDPEVDEFSLGLNEQVQLRRHDDSKTRNLYCVRTFPAMHPEAYLSIRCWNENGDDIELGILKDLQEWPEEAQSLIRTSLRRQYLLRRIEKIYSLRLASGFLDFDVQTDKGRATFTMRWTQSRVTNFGQNGRLLIDTDDNRFVVSDVDQLSARDREIFLQYVYW